MEGEEEEDAEYSALVKELCPDYFADKFVDFNVTVSTTESQFKTHAVDCLKKAECIGKVTEPQCVENKIISDETDEEEEGEKLIGPSILESLTILDQVCECPSLDEKHWHSCGK